MLFRLIEAECGLCCDVKSGNGGGATKGLRQTEGGWGMTKTGVTLMFVRGQSTTVPYVPLL